MTPEIRERLNEGIALLLDHKPTEWFIQSSRTGTCFGPYASAKLALADLNGSAFSNSGRVFPSRPDYFSDDLPIRTRGEMWDVLTDEQKIAMVMDFYGDWNAYTMRDMVSAFKFALSPEFTPLFCRVVGIDGKESK